jgi:hypothetical protein
MKFLRIQLLLIAALILLAANAAFASFSYDITVDTHTLVGTTGSLDFMFGPSTGSGSYTATVDISGLTGGTLVGAPSTTGNVSGVLPSTVTLTDNNVSALNDYFHQFTYGSTLTFNLNFTGNYGSALAFSMFQDAAGTTSAFTNDATNGFAATFAMNPNGTATFTNFSPQTTVTDATPTPLPAAAWLFGSGLMGLAGIRTRKTA